MFLAGLLPMVFHPCTTQGHLPCGGITHNVVWAIAIIHQENVSQTGQYAESIFSIEVPSTQMNPVSVKLTKN